MIIPSIDIMNGKAVQLIGGKEKVLDGFDPIEMAKKFRLVGEIAVIDLDAAMGKGSNAEIIKEIIKIASCRVGGGIRDVETALKWLDLGAEKVILGTQAKPEILRNLPRNRVMAALDAKEGEIMVEGWQIGTGQNVIDKIKELEQYVGGFLITFIELEGRLKGTNLERIQELKKFSKTSKITAAGGISTAKEVATLDQWGIDSQVGMALYQEKLTLADTLIASLEVKNPNPPWPTVVVDEQGIALGLVYSNQESIREAIRSKKGVYYSRSRGLWKKGESSGNTQELISIDLDCDRDCLRFRVKQKGKGFCHLNTRSCWGNDSGLTGLFQRLNERKSSVVEGSYTQRLLNDSTLLNSKILEEAKELVQAKSKEEMIRESSDLIYFTLVSLVKSGVELQDIENELDLRSKKVFRRNGNAKIKEKNNA